MSSRGSRRQSSRKKRSQALSSQQRASGAKRSSVGFLRRYRLFIVIAAAAVLIAAALLIIFLVLIPSAKQSNKDVQTLETDVYVAPDEDIPIERPADEEVQENAAIIGLVIGGEAREALKDGFGECAQSLITAGSGLDKYYIYESGSTVNQQVQDVRSLVSRGCSAIVLAGMDSAAVDAIIAVTEEAGVPVIGVGMPDMKTSVSVTGSEAWYGGYAESAKKHYAEGKSVLFVSDSNNSDFTNGAKAALAAEGVPVSREIYSADTGFESDLVNALAENKDIVIAKGNLAQEVIMKAAESDNIPNVFITRATAGIISLWHELKGDGIVVKTTEVKLDPEPEDGEDPIETEQRVTSQAALIYAYIGQDDSMLGQAACLFAYEFAKGGELLEPHPSYTVSTNVMITDDDIEKYYEMYKEASADKYITGETDPETIAAYFKKAE